jgi:hypothetical protein
MSTGITRNKIELYAESEDVLMFEYLSMLDDAYYTKMLHPHIAKKVAMADLHHKHS